jgi:hypothetical protein
MPGPRLHVVCVAMCGLAPWLAGCADFPELDAASRARITGDRPAPAIAPIDGIRAEALQVTITDEGVAALQARAAALQARGAGLQGPVGAPETVARLTERAACPAPGPACVASPAATR